MPAASNGPDDGGGAAGVGGRVLKPVEGAALRLADRLPGHAEPGTDLRPRERRTVQAGAHGDHLPVDRGQRGQATLQVLEHAAQLLGAGAGEHHGERSGTRRARAAAEAASGGASSEHSSGTAARAAEVGVVPG